MTPEPTTDCRDQLTDRPTLHQFFAPYGAGLRVATLLVHIADGTPTLGGTIGDKAEVTNHECQQWWHELGSVVQGETVRTRRESTQPLGGEGGRGGAKTNLFNLSRGGKIRERDLNVIWLI